MLFYHITQHILLHNIKHIMKNARLILIVDFMSFIYKNE